MLTKHHGRIFPSKAGSTTLDLQMRDPLPDSLYEPLSPKSTTENFTGGLGMIQIVRYLDTPVGPYDELLVIPGTYQIADGPQRGKSRLRITRIYVSQRETTYNGRKNWNIPKHLARFEFSAPPVGQGEKPSKELTVSVCPPAGREDSDRPFFTATITPSKWLPAFPFSTAWLPMNVTLVQPPLPAGENELLCGTEDWKMFRPKLFTKRARLMYASAAAGNDDMDEDRHWPNSSQVNPWSVGLWIEDATFEIPVPESFGLHP